MIEREEEQMERRDSKRRRRGGGAACMKEMDGKEGQVKKGVSDLGNGRVMNG